MNYTSWNISESSNIVILCTVWKKKYLIDDDKKTLRVKFGSRTTISQDVQTWFHVQLAFAKFLSKIKGNFWVIAVSMILALYWKFPFIFDRNLAKANCTENHVCTSCDKIVLGLVYNFEWSVQQRRMPTLNIVMCSNCVYSVFSIFPSHISHIHFAFSNAIFLCPWSSCCSCTVTLITIAGSCSTTSSCRCIFSCCTCWVSLFL